MASVHIPAAMRSLTGGASQAEAPGETLEQVIDALEARYPGLKARLVEDGRLRRGLALFVDGELPLTGLATRLKPDAEVYFAPAIAGGDGAGAAGR
jgi:molybdopterin synthase sulfur carrier subunit